jgi:peptide/nickel transport system substrate-binding protein
MTNFLKTGGVSRRGVLKGATAIGAAALVTPWGTPLRAQPARGGTLRVGIATGGSTDALDPGSWEAEFMIFQAHTRNNFLTEIAADGSLVPELATGWEATPDATVWTFNIREGVQFHSGHILTAEDVAASINHHRGPDSTSAAAPIVAGITDITTDGMNVIFTLEAGNADFPFLMSDYHLPILPAQADGTIDPNTTDGCGPFRMDNIEFGVRADYTRHDGYWKEGLPYFDAIEQILIFDDAARQNALISGEVDYIDAVDLNTVALLERAPGINVLAVTGTQHYGFPMDTRAAPFDDVNVRLALKYSINRQQMVDTILNGYGTVGNDHPIGPSQPFFNTELEQKEYDPDRARFHLSEAGLDSLDVDINLADAAFAGRWMPVSCSPKAPRRRGSTSTSCASPTTATGPTSGCRSPSPAPTGVAVRRRTGCSPPPMPRAFRGTRPTGANERFNELLLRRARNSTRISARRCTSRCSRSCSDEGGIIIPMFAQYVGAYSDALAHPDQVAGNWRNDGHRIGERWWFTA